MASNKRFKWSDLVVVPVGLMGPFCGSWMFVGLELLTGKSTAMLGFFMYGWKMGVGLDLVIGIVTSIAFGIGMLIVCTVWYIGPSFVGLVFVRVAPKLVQSKVGYSRFNG